MNVDSEGNVSMIFHGPDIIDGISISVTKAKCTIDVEGITKTYSVDQIPSDSPIILVYKALNKAENISTKTTNKKTTIENNSEYGNYILEIDSIGFITSLKSTKNSTEIIFSNHIENN